MTHDELLTRINHQADTWEEPMAKALRAVVELHKSEQRCYDATCYCKDMCSKCKEDYPCSEIQAIEKALV